MDGHDVELAGDQEEVVRDADDTWSRPEMVTGKRGTGAKGGKVRKGEHCEFTADLSEQVVNTITQYMDDSLPEALSARWRC